MKIELSTYNPAWAQTFEEINSELLELIGFLNPVIEHIGSTSVQGLSAKPIIDILVGLNDEADLDKTIEPLVGNGYVYYEKYNANMPYRRFFIKHKIDHNTLAIPYIIKAADKVPDEANEHSYRLAHIHILPYNSEHWIRQHCFP